MNNILIFGDSITWGACDTKGGWADRVKRYTDKKALSTENYYSPTYILGISGDTTKGLLKRIEQEAIIRIDPNYETTTIIAIGINDSQVDLKSNTNEISAKEFQRNLNKIIATAKSFSKNIIFVGISPVDEERVNPTPWELTHGYTDAEVEKYNEIIKNTSRSNNLHFIDIQNHPLMKDFKLLLFDGLHPTTEGHEVMYKVISEYLLENKFI